MIIQTTCSLRLSVSFFSFVILSEKRDGEVFRWDIWTLQQRVSPSCPPQTDEYPWESAIDLSQRQLSTACLSSSKDRGENAGNGGQECEDVNNVGVDDVVDVDVGEDHSEVVNRGDWHTGKQKENKQGG